MSLWVSGSFSRSGLAAKQHVARGIANCYLANLACNDFRAGWQIGYGYVTDRCHSELANLFGGISTYSGSFALNKSNGADLTKRRILLITYLHILIWIRP